MPQAAEREAAGSRSACSTARITNKTRVEGDILRNERSDIGGRFMLRDRVVVATARPVDYAIRSSARFADSNGTRDCSWNRPTQTDRFGMAIYPQRDRIAIKYSLVSGGWACKDAPEHPSCGIGDGGDASVMFYKEIEFTRRWIKLPVDLQWRSRENVACEFRWNGFVRLKKLRDGK
ncbi:hypothetical protein VSS74_05615 [Conexibacter stalactiti]|uniref:Uncharacterized protein n=1 Tax=Conexibacter stalactiti TaxID=1940611 RepID=A0ABU4HKH8_9ACTN|nr:hypothetical protein [Conexibacter stalactiti]MDW5593801.1 hypothetical protein [Conexibacter stalactiti]MEC5034443.1 hypothetical protein [Conexibacter stalactiti]